MKKSMQKFVSRFLAICIVAALVPAFGTTVGAELGKNEAIYYINQNEDGVTDNVIAASYNGVSYVMGAISADGRAEAIPAEKSDAYGNTIVIDETSAELFKVTTELYKYSGGSYWLYRMITENGYIADGYGADSEEHTLAVFDKETVDASDTKPYYNWRFSWENGWHNRDTGYCIYLVSDGESIYFELCATSPADGREYTSVRMFSRGCQHLNMQYVPAVSPTCKKDGNGAHWYCPDCAANNTAAYFSDADGLYSSFNPPVTMSYGAVDADRDGVCDDCGKNMPEYRKVTSDSQIVAGGKYILVSKIGDKYYAAATGGKEYGIELPTVEITPAADGTFTFDSAADAMTVELLFANGCTDWGNGIRYGFVTKFDGRRSEFAPNYGGEFYFDEYDVRGAKYGFYVGLNADGTAVIHSAYSEEDLIRSYSDSEACLFTMADYSENTAYTESPVYLYRLTDTGTVGSNTYDMTAVKSRTDYNTAIEGGADAEGGTNVTGVTDALTQTAIDDLVRTFVSDQAVSGDENIHIDTGVSVAVTDYLADNSITLSLTPTAVVSGNEVTHSYNISDSDFDGITPMTVILYTGGIFPAQIIHEKQDGTNEYFYPDYSKEVMADGKNPFYELFDNSGNMYVSFTVTEFSDVKLLTEPVAEDDAPMRGDIDSDGKVTSKDLNLMKQVMVGKISLEGTAFSVADLNGDGKITSKDLNLMKQAIVGLISLK